MKHINLLIFFIKEKLPLKGYINYERNVVRDKFLWFVMFHMTNIPLVWIAVNFILTDDEVKYIKDTYFDMAYGRKGFKKYGRDDELIAILADTINSL